MITIACIIPTTGKLTSVSCLRRALNSLAINSTDEVKIDAYIITELSLSRFNLKNRVRTLVRMVSESCGFGYKNNLAIEKILSQHKYDYILLLNDDAYLSKHFSQNLTKVLSSQNKNLDVIIPLIYSESDKKTIDSFGMEIFSSGYAHDSQSLTAHTNWGTAACILFSLSFVQQVKAKFGFFFCPLFQYYYEDVELAIRCFSLDPRIVKSPDLTAYHYRSKTSGKKSEFNTKNTLKNYLWYTIISWPTIFWLHNWWRFVIVYVWLVIRTILDGDFAIISFVISETLKTIPKLKRYRSNITEKYQSSFHLKKHLSPFLFRTRKNHRLIKI